MVGWWLVVGGWRTGGGRSGGGGALKTKDPHIKVGVWVFHSSYDSAVRGPSEALEVTQAICQGNWTLCSVNPANGVSRALLDGGATHMLRPVKRRIRSGHSHQGGARGRGVTTLRQVGATGTLITDFDTQTIVPVGKVVRLGYSVKWEGHLRTLGSSCHED